MALSAKEAAELVGMSKTGLIKAMRAGKISAYKDTHGEWRVEPVELLRVYPAATLDEPAEPQDTPADIRVLEVEIEQLRQRLEDKTRENENLWRRFEAEAEERMKLTRILTDSRAERPKPWWSRIFGA